MRPPTATRPDVGLMIPREQAQQRRLAGAVAADEADRAARLDRERDVAQRPDVRAARRGRARRTDPSARGSRADRRGSCRAACSTTISPGLTRLTVPAVLAARSRRASATNAGSSFGISIRASSQAELARALLRLDVEVPADLQMVGDEADRADEHAFDALRVQVARGGRGCRARATARRSATRSGTRTTSRRRRPRRRRGARSRAAGPCTDRPRRGCARAASAR